MTAAANGRMLMGPGHGVGPGLVPEWVAVIWLLMFAAIVVAHSRHLLASHGQRRIWHAGHVLMALGMVVMYTDFAFGGVGPASGVWRTGFGYAAAMTVAWAVLQLLRGRAVNVLWATAVLDLTAMAYMWSPGGVHGPITWLFVCYLLAQAALWAVSAPRRLDGVWQLGAEPQISSPGAGTLVVSAARSEPLICGLELRASMIAMTAGMAYMLVAMQLLS
jgi:hypothetical protein